MFLCYNESAHQVYGVLTIKGNLHLNSQWKFESLWWKHYSEWIKVLVIPVWCRWCCSGRRRLSPSRHWSSTLRAPTPSLETASSLARGKELTEICVANNFDISPIISSSVNIFRIVPAPSWCDFPLYKARLQRMYWWNWSFYLFCIFIFFFFIHFLYWL